MTFHAGFQDELVKLSASRIVGKAAEGAKGALSPFQELSRLKETNPGKYRQVMRILSSKKGPAIAKGVMYGLAGYKGLKGMSRRNKDTGKREPLTGVLRGAAGGALMGLPLLLFMKHRALKSALSKARPTNRFASIRPRHSRR